MNSTSDLKVIITTDFGADCDDQKAVSDAITKLQDGQDITFIVSGPHPYLAAAAIAEKYHAVTGRYPQIMIGKQFEDDKKKEDHIYSLVDGRPMIDKLRESPALEAVFLQTILSAEDFQEAIDRQVRSGSIKSFEQIVIAPLHTGFEYYNPGRPELQHDEVFKKEWRKILKTSTTQFQRDGTEYKGNNYQKSGQGVADDYLSMLANQEFQQFYIDGAVAKLPEFLITVVQPNNIGIQRAMESYMATMQVPWFNMMEELGKTPTSPNMHAGMFTAGAQFPFGVHVTNGTPAGFGTERGLREICNITPEQPEYELIIGQISAGHDRFDQHVVNILHEKQAGSGIETVADMRQFMHSSMLTALQEFGRNKGILDEAETIEGFKELFDKAKAKGTPLNPYNYMGDYTAILFSKCPIVKEISAIAQSEMDKPMPGAGKSYVETLVSILSKNRALGVMYDAVAVAAANTIRGNSKLQDYFKEAATQGADILNITKTRVDSLKEDQPDLYDVFKEGIRTTLRLDGCVLATP